MLKLVRHESESPEKDIAGQLVEELYQLEPMLKQDKLSASEISPPNRELFLCGLKFEGAFSDGASRVDIRGREIIEADEENFYRKTEEWEVAVTAYDPLGDIEVKVCILKKDGEELTAEYREDPEFGFENDPELPARLYGEVWEDVLEVDDTEEDDVDSAAWERVHQYHSWRRHREGDDIAGTEDILGAVKRINDCRKIARMLFVLEKISKGQKNDS